MRKYKKVNLEKTFLGNDYIFLPDWVSLEIMEDMEYLLEMYFGMGIDEFDEAVEQDRHLTTSQGWRRTWPAKPMRVLNSALESYNFEPIPIVSAQGPTLEPELCYIDYSNLTG